MNSSSGCRVLLILAAALLVPLSRLQADPELMQFQHPVMGTLFTVQLYAEESDQSTAEAAARSAFVRADALNAIFSDYDAESELLRFCREPAGTRVPLSPELYDILQTSLDLARRSEGAFDPTVGPLTRLWKHTKRDGRLPTPEKLAEARTITGWQKLHLHEDGTASLDLDRMRLNLGGIAKGYAADEMLKVLKDAGFPIALVAASGDIVTGDPPPGEAGWKVQLRGLPAGPGGELETVQLTHAAVSTSGDLEQFIEVDGVRYSHIVSPASGLGVTHHHLVTIIAPEGTTTDSLATTLSVMEMDAGLALVEQLEGVEACIQTDSGLRMTSGFPAPAS